MDAYSCRRLVLSHLVFAFVVMLRPVAPELVVFQGYPLVLLFCSIVLQVVHVKNMKCAAKSVNKCPHNNAKQYECYQNRMTEKEVILH